jgi:hypothetical protein
VNELQFLARIIPGGRLLLEKCLKALHIGEDKSIDLGWETLAAAEILGNQFAHDEGVYKRIIAECEGTWAPYHAVLALCEAWPKSEVLDRYQGDLTLDHIRNLFTSIVVIRFLCLKDSAEGVWKTLIRVLTNRRPQNLSEATYAPVVRRIRNDELLYEIASAELLNQPSPTLKASLPRILIAARGISPNLRTWCLGELENQTVRNRASEIGFDIAAGAYRLVTYSIMDAMDTRSGGRHR